MYFMVTQASGKDMSYFESRPMEMLDHLHKLLGSGYVGIERIIISEVQKTFDLDESDITLQSAIEHARVKFLNLSGG